MKKRHFDVNEPLIVKFEKFKQHFHQVVKAIEEKYCRLCELPLEELISLYPKSFEMQLVRSHIFLRPRPVPKAFSLL